MAKVRQPERNAIINAQRREATRIKKELALRRLNSTSGDFNPKGISTHQIQAEIGTTKLISMINGILNNKSKVIGLRR